ncbi:hypothetical protein GJR96_08875 [Haloferax sp. MBLA0076]|uniref:ABM domain-containing protein n=1 Tax=Haloferax litoreum TaxID=2666140 RepID=A0A6A8GIV6_9EURY|nr:MULTISPECIES: DUF6176 family protein [Haloferax]KAB1193552.1 hypothetical protein Hfx1148_08860 [Haloferax sp. CBA1148]MRX22067.1 hypothetical protein [Haloferax litoreum]
MVDTFVRKQRIKPGKTDAVFEWVDELRTEAREDRDGVRAIWDEETLQTLSLFVEYGDEYDYLVWYIEAEDFEQLVEARAKSTHPLHELEDELMETLLEDPTEAGSFEPLFHGVNPDRSTEFVVQ